MWEGKTPWRVVIKDSVLLIVGSSGAIHEEFFRPEASLPLLGFWLIILGFPVAQGLRWLSQSTPGGFLSSSSAQDSLTSSSPSGSTGGESGE